MASRPDEKIAGLKMSTFLVGEPYRDFADPQYNSHVQRTWVYGKEKSLEVAENNLNNTISKMGGRGTQNAIMSNLRKSTLPRFRVGDGPNTLPIESRFTNNFLDGEHQFFPKFSHNGAYRKKQSDVTRVRNNPITFK